jgi:hypothetical protein
VLTAFAPKVHTVFENENQSEGSAELVYGDSKDDVLAVDHQDKPTVLGTSFQNNTQNQTMCVPVAGEITSPFGYRIHPIYGTKLFHNGVDIGADSGTPIVAALSGTVVTADYNDSYGNYMILDHGGGFSTVYAHCSQLLAEKGQVVEKATPIALVGLPSQMADIVPGFETYRDPNGMWMSDALCFADHDRWRRYFDTVLMNSALFAPEDIWYGMADHPQVVEMPVYPASDSLAMVDGVLVMKLS